MQEKILMSWFAVNSYECWHCENGSKGGRKFVTRLTIDD
jgi:hypothetical protein